MFINNSGDVYEIVAQGTQLEDEILNNDLWSKLKNKYNG
jgi:hypothetical protein